MHLDFTITWVSLSVAAGTVTIVWRVAVGVKTIVSAVVGLVTFCQRIMREHEQMWKTHCANYELDAHTGLPVVMNGPTEI